MTGETGVTRKDDKSPEFSVPRDKIPDKIEVRDKLVRTPPNKLEKNVSSSRSHHARSKTQDGKSKHHVSRPVEKLKSAADRRSSSSQSVKRQRSQSPTDINDDKLVSEMDTNTKNDELKCPDCKKPFLKDDSCLFCECCARWFHSVCHNISEEQVTAFKILGELAHYYCPNCKSGASELHKATVDMRYRVESLEKNCRKDQH